MSDTLPMNQTGGQGGNKSRAARELGISRRGLVKMLARLDLPE